MNLNFMTIKICDLALKSKDNTVAENETRIKGKIRYANFFAMQSTHVEMASHNKTNIAK